LNLFRFLFFFFFFLLICLEADPGQPLGVAVRAEATATFVAAKLGFDAPGAADYTGEVAVIDIGVPRRLLEPYLTHR
jgi:NAD(P)H-hydrate epimerase